MPLKDVALALLVIFIWGANFVVIKLGIDEFPPLLLGALRFIFVAFPAVFFVPRPRIHWSYVVGYGLTICLMQFVFLFVAMDIGMPPGLASLVLQSQVFITAAIAAVVLHEAIRTQHLLGMALAALGLYLLYPGSDAQVSVPLMGFLFTIVAASGWSAGNVILKSAGSVPMLPIVVWGSLVPPIPFLLLSWWFDGADGMLAGLLNISWRGVATVLYLSVLASLVGYVQWGKLLSRYPVSRVAPLSLLIPIVGTLCARWFMDERMSATQWFGGAVVMAGLVVNLFGRQGYERLRAALGR